jgi:8-oxo-dGTP diphosphatase
MKKQIDTVICEDIEGNKFEVKTSELTFRPAVYGIIIKDKKILLSKQWDGYDFPGGGIELGEDTQNALIREVKEETGMDVKPLKIQYCSNSFFKLPFKGNFVHSIHMYYKCDITGGELSTEFFDENEVKYADHPEWVDLDKIPNIKIYSSVDAMEVLKDLI